MIRTLWCPSNISLSHKVEDEIRRALPQIAEVLVHVEPEEELARLTDQIQRLTGTATHILLWARVRASPTITAARDRFGRVPQPETAPTS